MNRQKAWAAFVVLLALAGCGKKTSKVSEIQYATVEKKTIEVKDAAAVGLDAGALAPRAVVTGLELPPARQAVKMIEGDADTQVKELLRLLHEEAKVL